MRINTHAIAYHKIPYENSMRLSECNLEDVMLVKNEIIKALQKFDIEDNAILLVHSSLKALGYIDGGAETVIEALEETVPKGTLVMPTLSQKNWETVFEDWTLDRPSDVGFITETFRKQKGSLRSDNATYSVAARGVHAADLVGGDPKKGARYGIFGDFCFSYESPWQRMYDSRERYGVKAYVMFWGCTMRRNTFQHFCEYRLAEEVLNSIEDADKRAMFKERLAHYPWTPGVPLVWPTYDSESFGTVLEEMGLAKRITLGNGEIICTDIYDMVNATEKAIRDDMQNMISARGLAWIEDARKA